MFLGPLPARIDRQIAHIVLNYLFEIFFFFLVLGLTVLVILDFIKTLMVDGNQNVLMGYGLTDHLLLLCL